MPKALKWGMIHLYTLFFQKDIHKMNAPLTYSLWQIVWISPMAVLDFLFLWKTTKICHEAPGGSGTSSLGVAPPRFWQISQPYLNQEGADYAHQIILAPPDIHSKALRIRLANQWLIWLWNCRFFLQPHMWRTKCRPFKSHALETNAFSQNICTNTVYKAGLVNS